MKEDNEMNPLNRFRSAFESLMQSVGDSILLESEESIFSPVIYESLLDAPKYLAFLVEQAVVKLQADEDYKSAIKVDLKEAIDDEYCRSLDVETATLLKELFSKLDDVYFKVKIAKQEDSFNFSEECGTFILPEKLQELAVEEMKESHMRIPKVRRLNVDSKLINDFCREFKKRAKKAIDKFSKRQNVIEAFRSSVLEECGGCFGTIVIYPAACGDDLDHFTLNEAIVHECLHLCIFLLSVAKTCIWLGVHFSNSILNGSVPYELNKLEFIALFTSYKSLLLRVYAEIAKPKNMNEFIHAVLDECILSKHSDSKYTTALRNSKLFMPLKNFYQKIYKDSYVKKYDRIVNDGKFKKITAAETAGSRSSTQF